MTQDSPEQVPDRPTAIDLYWEDLSVGHTAVSPGRTVTEADLMSFAGLSGDYNQVHVDAVFAAAQGFGGKRLVHGLLGQTIASGLHTRTWLGTGTQRHLIAMLEIRCRFRGPIFIGDTLTSTVRVSGLRESSRPERGHVELERLLHNQTGDLVQEAGSVFMMRRRP